MSEIDSKAREIGLLLKPSKCVSLLYDGSKFLSKGISLIGGTTKSILEGPTKFLGKLIDVSVHSTKIAAGKSIIDRFTALLSKVDQMSLQPEYKVWIYRNYILSIIRFHLTVDCVGPSTITRMENLATRYLKQWLRLPRSATRVILYYPGVCSPSISLTVKNCKLSLLANVSQSSDPALQELVLQLDIGSGMFQINGRHHGILSQAREQLISIPSAKKLYHACKTIAAAEEKAQCVQKLNSLSVQCKFSDAAFLETSNQLWNRLLLGFHPGQLSFILRASSDTLPTPLNLRR